MSAAHKPACICVACEDNRRSDPLRIFLARGLAASQAVDDRRRRGAGDAVLVDELERALQACAAVGAREAWPGGEFSASVEAVLRQYIGNCGHFGHDPLCRCEEM